MSLFKPVLFYSFLVIYCPCAYHPKSYENKDDDVDWFPWVTSNEDEDITVVHNNVYFADNADDSYCVAHNNYFSLD